jgi:excisionase family DNA binding protein
MSVDNVELQMIQREPGELRIKPLRTAEEIAPILRVKPERVYEMARLGILPKGVVIKLGRQVRFDEERLREWMQNGGKGIK